MGYYTTFSLDIIGDLPKPEEEIVEELGVLSTYTDWLFDDAIKWYEHEEEMKQLSSEYPTILFTLYGIGEESSRPDIWVKYFKNGKMQAEMVKVVYPEFNERSLV